MQALNTTKPQVRLHPNTEVEFEKLLYVLPTWIRDQVEPFGLDLDEIYMDLGRPLTVTVNDEARILEESGRIISRNDLQHVTDRLGGFKANQRAGIEGTLHRFSRILDGIGGITTGITIRVGRFLVGVAEPLKEALYESAGRMLVVGPPRAGKTTLLRDIVRLLAQRWGPRVMVVDTSNEIGGDGYIPHIGIAPARRMQVPDPPSLHQALIIYQAIANHSPEIVVVDEIGYNDDVAVVQTASKRGVNVLATAHGKTIRDLLENPVLWPILGDVIPGEGRRLSRPAFQSVLEVRGRGEWVYHPSLADAVDALLRGELPEGVEIRL